MINKYPRIQLKRDSFYSLNGLWKLNGKDIVVPYPPLSKLSNNDCNDEILEYTKEFILPKDINNDLILLHFNGVDQIAKVYLNNILLGIHEGGYLPFSYNIKPYLKDNNILKVICIDTLNKDYPYGKQSNTSKGMWYTKVSGIWQSVWIEAVSNDYIKDLKITTTLNTISLNINSIASKYKISINNKEIGIYDSNNIDINIDNAHLWSNEDPYLYSLTIETKNDKIESYFGLREIKILNNQLYLNNKRIFLNGVLDQGYFYDGLFIPNNEEEYLKDILNMKKLGFNTIRKHIKIENEWFYYYCDKVGMLVIQDHVNNGDYNYIKDTVLPNIGITKRKDIKKETITQEIFIKHMKDTINYLYNHPSIIIYTIFNEGWGQFNSDKMYKLCKEIDPTRLYDSTSGWFKQQLSDFDSYHIYFKNKLLNSNKIMLLSECGGYSRVIENHSYNSKVYGYGKCDSKESLTLKIEELYNNMIIPSINNGLCGSIYTQLSDIENELNGLYTYDRQVCKVDINRIYKLSLEILKRISE